MLCILVVGCFLWFFLFKYVGEGFYSYFIDFFIGFVDRRVVCVIR